MATKMQRNPSSTSMRTTVTSSAASNASTASAQKKSRAKELMREYYGLAGGDKAVKEKGDPLNLDSPSFNAPVYLNHLINNSTLPQLLRTSNQLSGSIADLESERQSLVYNHHHELIDASITISKMKVRAESLDSTLEQLKAGLARCSELESGLRGVPGEQAEEAENGDWQLALGTLLDLPLTLQVADKQEALRLWGRYEPVLRKWRDAGVQGIEQVETECREVLSARSVMDEEDDDGPNSASSIGRRRSGSTLTLRP